MASDRKKMSVDSDDSDKGKLAGCWSAFCVQWHGFLNFLYNPVEKTVFGRGAKSWGQILIFYTFYYAFLAGLFAVSITIVLGTLDPFVPRFQTRLQAPGLSLQPRQPSRIELTSDIVFNQSNEDTYKPYVTLLNEFLAGYSDQNNSELYIQNCPNGKVKHHQEFRDDETARVCVFNTSTLESCAVPKYGYHLGEPCILLKANRIVNWFPVAFNDLDDAVGNDDSDAPPLRTVLRVLGHQYDPYMMYFSCYGSDAENQRFLTGSSEVNNQIKYYPDGVPFKFFPYYGKARSPQYKTPVVAVKFLNVTRNQEIKVRCKVYARNIIDDDRMQVGYMQFKLQVNT